MKIFIVYYCEGCWDYRVMFDSGGMFSFYIVFVVGLMIFIVYLYGLGSVYFLMLLVFMLIVMYDVVGVR